LNKASPDRPRSIAQIASFGRGDGAAFDRLACEFLDVWQGLSGTERGAAISEAPQIVGQPQDAYLAAVAEHLALGSRLAAPDWTNAANRFLREPFFAGGLESPNATLLVESPLTFRRRLIFISADGLSRPQRRDVKSTANLDV
jgi:hypothetical protein